MATNTIKGNNTGATANALDLTTTQTTAMLDAMVGASGIANGTKGLVPTPNIVNQLQFLRGDGTWAMPAGGSAGITRSVSSIAIATTGGATASTDYVYLCTVTLTFTLPTAVGNTNRYTIKNV